MDTHDLVTQIFEELDKRLEEITAERRAEGLSGLPKAQVKLLGQMSLLVQREVSAILSLAQTGDMDASLLIENVGKQELKLILKSKGLIYDEDSYLIWIPPGAKFLPLLDFDQVEVWVLDAESALVSKAVKAPKKNAFLIRQAIASEQFPGLVERIVANGGNLEDFL